MPSLLKTPWALSLAALVLACSNNPPTSTGSDGASNINGGPSTSSGGATSTTTTVGSPSTETGSVTTTAGGASGTVTSSNGSTVSTGAGGSGGTGMTSTVVPGAEGFDCTPSDGSSPGLQATQVAGDLYAPLGIYFAPGAGRGYITLAEGEIFILENGNVGSTPFLDISDRIDREDVPHEERGLLGMAFHPDFQSNGKFFLSYTTGGSENGNGQNVISEFSVSGDPNVADAGSENVLLTIPQPDDNHNGGGLAIGLDSNLYISVGDGGFGLMPSADEHDNGQNANSLLGTVLRIGFDGSVPAGNMAGAAAQIWDIGLRNPWRISSDGCTGDLYIADVGYQSELASSEEINVEPPMNGGNNYGWPIMEGDSCREDSCDMSPFVLPTDFYGWQSGSAVIGGYVYRGSSIPGLRGTYLYADYASLQFRAFDYAGGVAGNSRDLNVNGLDSARAIVSFGQDSSGEVYIVTWSGPPEYTHTEGEIYRLGPG